MKSMQQSLRIISLMLSLGGASPGHAAFADLDAMAEHCQSMPDMPGCERYRPTHSTAPPAASNVAHEGQGRCPFAVATPVVELKDGVIIICCVGLVTKTIAGTLLRLYAYNGSVPGPRIKVQQGSTVTIEFENAIDQGHHGSLARAAGGCPARRDTGASAKRRCRWRKQLLYTALP